jgi:MarR family transcriptional regulator, temperature-dependent positive regulator of motility
MPHPRRHEASREAAEALVRTAPVVSRWIERLLATHDPPLTVAQYLALQAIAEDEVVSAELARRTAVSAAAVSQLIDTLEDSRLLARTARTDDRRRQPLVLTELGRKTLRSAQAALRDRLAGLLADLPSAEADALARLLDRLQASLSGTPPPPLPHRPPQPASYGRKPSKQPDH